jgi:arginine:pyruvate transaminase
LKFSSLTKRISGESVDAWEVHYDGLARKESGEDIIVLSVGQETDERTDDVIVSSAIDSLKRGRHHYTQVQGNRVLRQAIAKRHNELTGQGVSESNCAVFSGAQNALFAAAMCVLEHGDEVILIEPYYTTYLATFTASGATLVSVAVTAENNFQIDPEEVLAAITDKTRAIVLNSPNNPVGAVYSLDQFRPLVDACVEKGIWLINDEVYQEILKPQDRASPASLPGADQVCITVSSLSKSHRMTGWRLGWIVGPELLMENLYNLSMCMAYGLPGFIMDAAITAFSTGTTTAEKVRENMDTRRRIVVDRLQEVPGLGIFSSGGGMYVVVDVRESGLSSRQFARKLLDLHDIAVLPCDGFGESGKGLIRVSLCVADEQLVIACERIIEFVQSLK